MLKLLFTTESGPASALIRTFTWSDYSHVDLVFGNEVIGAYPGRGVERIPIDDRLKAASKAAFFMADGIEESAALEKAMSQINKPYDWLGVIGIGLHRDWQCQDKWFCSEFASWVAMQCGKPLLAGNFRRITPQDLLLSPMLEPAKE